jgi:hypothetical protein
VIIRFIAHDRQSGEPLQRTVALEVVGEGQNVLSARVTQETTPQGRSAFHLVGYPNVRIRQIKANFFYIVQALVHVKVGLDIAPFQIESLKRGPWSELRGQVPANIVSGKTEDAPDASKNMHLHLRSALLHSPDDRSDRV